MRLSEEQLRERGYTDAAIRALQVIASKPTDELRKLLRVEVVCDKEGLEALRQEIGPNTNPSWVKSQVAQELCFERKAMEVEEYDWIMR